MKIILILLFSAISISVTLAEKPTVKVYLIKKMEQKSPNTPFPQVILEISNPTKTVFYISGPEISSPVYNLEAKRDGKWLRVPIFICGTGHQIYPLKPGAKILVSPITPLDEKEFRFRYFFQTDAKWIPDEVISILSRPIKKSELGDLMGTVGELDSKTDLEAIEVVSAPLANENVFKTEAVTDAVAEKILKAIVPFTKIKDFPNGFERIEDVKFTWLNIAGAHTRRAVSGDLFLFPRLDTAKEDDAWTSGIALRRGSNIAYRWNLSQANAE